MARLPSGYDLSGPESLRSGRQISSADASASGRGMASLGSSIGQAGSVAAAIAAKEKQKTQVSDLASANTGLTEGSINLETSFENDVDFDTLEARAAEKAKKLIGEKAMLIRDPETRNLWTTRAEAEAAALVGKIAEKGRGRLRVVQQVTTDNMLSVHRKVYTDPRSTPEQKASARAVIEGTIAAASGSGIFDPVEADQRVKFYLEGADFDRGTLDRNIVPPREGYFAAIRAAESGGDDAARNPSSTATGRYQFTEPTWNGLMEQYPDAGLTVDGRTDAGQQERAIRLFTAENERQLAEAGVATTNSNLYAAHFLGAAGAVKVLSAPDGAAMEGLVDGAVIAANPFLAGMTVKDFRDWTEGKTGRDPAMPDYFERLTPEQQQTIFDMRNAEIQKAATEANAQATLDYRRADDAVTLGIVTGDIVSEQQIFDAGLDDADTAKHLKAFRSAQDVDAGAAELLNRLAAGEVVDINPYDANDTARVDKAWEAFVSREPDANSLDVASSFVAATGAIPKAVAADLRRTINSPDIGAVAQGLQYAARLNDVAPDAMRGAHEDLRDAVATYQTLVNAQGMTPAEAAAEMVRARDPATRRSDELLGAAFKQAVKDGRFGSNDLRSEFDTTWFFGGEPRLGVTPAQEMTLAEDYLTFAERAFRRANGNPDVARSIAIQEMRKTYGVTTVSGEPVLMRLPPENFYKPIDGGHAYLREKALEDAKSIDPSATSVSLWPIERETALDIQAGRPPRYNLLYLTPDDGWQMAANAFVVSPVEFAALREAASLRRHRQFDEARANQEAGPAITYRGVLPGPMPIVLGGVQ